ncbi:LytTR family transcriptional regulator DNA-binding domain-containing protein [Spirosoma daeguense]
MTFFFEQLASLPDDLRHYAPISLHLPDTGRRSFPVADLVYLEAQGSYTQYNWLEQPAFQLTRPLKYHHSKLPSNWFLRLHRDYVVNRRFIAQLDSSQTGFWAHLSTGLSLPIARRRWREVCQIMMGERSGSRSIQANFYTP